MNGKEKIVIYLYNRFFDPLIQGNFWLYIEDYLSDRRTPFEFHLITYEDPRFPLTAEQQQRVDLLKRQGLSWTRLTWHPGTGLANKVLDILSGFFAILLVRLKGYRRIITLGSVAGSYAYLSAWLLRMKLFMYQFEPHSEYAIDNNMWGKDSLQYRIAHYLERKSAEYASVIASGTRFMQARLETEWRVNAAFFKIATVANDGKFQFDQRLRDEVRSELNIDEHTRVLLYPGKFGSLYYYTETAWMFRWLLDLEPDLHFLIVTPHTDEEVHGIFGDASVPKDKYSIVHCDYSQIHRYYFAADFAVIAVPPGPSKQFISNIKVGEYLCAGLPFLITRGVSEDYWYAENKDVGVVVDDFRETDIKSAWPRIKEYLDRDMDARREHCRRIGLEYRGFANLNPVFKAAVQQLVNS